MNLQRNLVTTLKSIFLRKRSQNKIRSMLRELQKIKLQHGGNMAA